MLSETLFAVQTPYVQSFIPGKIAFYPVRPALQAPGGGCSNFDPQNASTYSQKILKLLSATLEKYKYYCTSSPWSLQNLLGQVLNKYCKNAPHKHAPQWNERPTPLQCVPANFALLDQEIPTPCVRGKKPSTTTSLLMSMRAPHGRCTAHGENWGQVWKRIQCVCE